MREGLKAARLRWRGSANKISVRETDGRKSGPFPLYESPMINLERGGLVRATAPQAKEK